MQQFWSVSCQLSEWVLTTQELFLPAEKLSLQMSSEFAVCVSCSIVQVVAVCVFCYIVRVVAQLDENSILQLTCVKHKE